MDRFWAAVIGGAVGGVLVAVVESVLSRLTDHERWLREQRQRYYAEFIDAANLLRRQQPRLHARRRSRHARTP